MRRCKPTWPPTPETPSLYVCHSTEGDPFFFFEVTCGICLAFWEFSPVGPTLKVTAGGHTHTHLPEESEKMISHSVTTAQRTGWPLGPHSPENDFS